MGTRLPASSAASSALGPNAEVMVYLQQKRAWQADRGVQGNATLDILRYTQSGGMAYYLVEPTYTQTTGLAGLLCYFDDAPEEYKKTFGSMVEEATCAFVLYDVPGGVSEHDILRFNNKEFTVLSVWTDDASGRFEVLAKQLQDL
jgi:hypothetical protein